jgi:hypothetical protein
MGKFNPDDFPDAPQAQPASGFNPDAFPDAPKKQSVEDLVAGFKKQMEPSQALSHGAASGASFGMFNRGLGLYDYLTGAAPSYGEGVDKRAADEAALAKAHPAAHLTGQLAGGAATGVGAARSGFTLAKAGAPLLERMVLGSAEGMGYGAAAGAGNTYSGNPMDYLHNAGTGAQIGAGVGAAAPAVVAGLGWAGSKVAQPFNFFRSDQDVARDRVTKAMMDAKGKTAAGIDTDIQSAEAAGQPGYSVVDAIGKPAQRELAVVAKQQGPARDLVTTELEPRNVAAPMRRASEVDKALGVEGTAKQAEAALLEKAQTESKPFYDAAMEKAPVHNDIIAEGIQHPIMRKAVAQGIKLQSVENAMTGKPFNPTDPAIVGFDEAGDPIIKGVPNMRTLQQAKIGLDRMIDEAVNPATGQTSQYGRALIGFKNRLLEQINAINPEFAAANKIYAGPMSVRKAVDAGRDMASPNARFADVLDEFRANDPNIQQGNRIGLANQLNAPLERGQIPSQLTPKSQQGTNILNEMSLYQGPNKPVPNANLMEPSPGGVPGENQWRTFMNREDAMAKTNQAALGGPATAENIADMTAQQSAIPKIGGALARGEVKTALGHAWELAKVIGRGESEGARHEIAKALLLRSSDGGAEYQALIDHLGRAEAAKAAAAGGPATQGRGITGGMVGAAPYDRRR